MISATTEDVYVYIPVEKSIFVRFIEQANEVNKTAQEYLESLINNREE